jgi:hypothetical protein
MLKSYLNTFLVIFGTRMGKMKFLILFIMMIPGSFTATGQSGHTHDPVNRLKQKEINGTVILEMDSLIFDNYRKHLIQNSRNRGVEGYRIRIFSDNGHGAKENQMRVRASFLSLFPEIPTYYRYEGSYYKIYVGDFRTKRDALKTLAVISKDFPDAFIVEDKIVLKDGP